MIPAEDRMACNGCGYQYPKVELETVRKSNGPFLPSTYQALCPTCKYEYEQKEEAKESK